MILRSNGIRTVALTGVVTNVCVETTAREAFVRDYYVVAVDDGCAAYIEADHIASLSNIDRFFGQVATIKQGRRSGKARLRRKSRRNSAWVVPSLSIFSRTTASDEIVALGYAEKYVS